MNTRAQLKKIKIQLHELLTTWNTTRQREINIHKAEIERIAIKTADFREWCAEEAKELQAQKMVILEEISTEQTKINKIAAELGQFNNTKFKLRQEVLLQIHSQNRAKKDMKRNREIFEKQLNDIKTQITQQQGVINNFETARRQINEDFYNWRDECAETNQKISELDPISKKADILRTYLNELSNDLRATPEVRYNLLDETQIKARADIEQLNYQYNKLQNYMAVFKDNLISQGEQVMSSYLTDASAEIPRLKNCQKELTEKISVLGQKVSGLEMKINELGSREIPVELKEQACRAEQRLQISGERLASEYEPLVNKLREQINNLEQQLMLDQQPQEIANTINNELPQRHIEYEPILVIKDKLEPADLSGKSRKEIERLKKQNRTDLIAPSNTVCSGLLALGKGNDDPSINVGGTV